MLVRCLRASHQPWARLRHGRARKSVLSRCLSSSTTAACPGQIPSLSPVTALVTDLDRIAPRIDIQSDQIEILEGPKDFYEALKRKIGKARRRIYLSTLYVGKSEHELVSCIRQALLRNGPDLKISILTDALRGARESPEPSCATLLLQLVNEFPEQVEVRMYHTPNLTGLRKALIPRRINEGWGLQHMKLYGFDDEVILSGANLSRDYFTNRQDRYHVFQSKKVTDYFSQIHDTVCSISFQLVPGSGPGSHELVWPATNPAPNPLKAPKEYIKYATSLLQPFIAPPEQVTPYGESSTSLYPLLVHPPTLNNEIEAFTTLFKRPIRSYVFTAGYFNPHPLITSALLSASSPPQSAPGSVLTASAFANGFYGSKGISGMLPPAYTHLSSRFLKAAHGKAIELREWQRGVVGQAGGWTYHAKGIWITLPPSQPPPPSPSSSLSSTPAEAETQSGTTDPGPSATLIGSSNYTTRSYGLDLEVGALVVTSDEGLMRKWRKEEQILMEHTRTVTEEELDSKNRRANWRVRIAMWIVRLVGGSL